jgi:hypothetical protein
MELSLLIDCSVSSFPACLTLSATWYPVHKYDYSNNANNVYQLYTLKAHDVTQGWAEFGGALVELGGCLGLAVGFDKLRLAEEAICLEVLIQRDHEVRNEKRVVGPKYVTPALLPSPSCRAEARDGT